MDASQLLKNARIVPVVVIDDPDAGVALAETLVAVGLNYVEITLRTENALAVIEKMAAKVADVIIGAGSVREPRQFAQARNVGARFAVSPGFSRRLTEAAGDAKLPFVPGGATASEFIRLRELGYSLVKFFPAELAGGISMLKALSGPLPEVRFFPTGGISAAHAPDYLALPNVSCLGGTWIAPADRLATRDFETIRELARQAADIATGPG